MKKVISLIFALLLMICAVASVAAEESPTPPVHEDYLIVDAIPVPGEAGVTTPDIKNPAKVKVGSGEVVTLTATPNDGYKFSHWEFVLGQFEWVEGDLTSPVIVIRPTGSSDVRAEAYFVKEGEDITTPSSKPTPTLPTDDKSPITGTDNTTAVTTSAIVGISIVSVAIVAVVILKKKSNA